MTEFYKTELETNLELSLESIKLPLGKRIYYGTEMPYRKSIRKSLTSLEKAIKPQKESLSDSEIQKTVKKIASNKGMHPIKLLAYGWDDAGYYLIKRTSPRNRQQFYVYYGVILSDDESYLKKLDPDKRIPEINKLIEKNKDYSEIVTIEKGTANYIDLLLDFEKTLIEKCTKSIPPETFDRFREFEG
ncbi:MAG: hypothetical protein AABW50_02650, partial [Nanoarchaeota archaeon]